MSGEGAGFLEVLVADEVALAYGFAGAEPCASDEAYEEGGEGVVGGDEVAVGLILGYLHGCQVVAEDVSLCLLDCECGVSEGIPYVAAVKGGLHSEAVGELPERHVPEERVPVEMLRTFTAEDEGRKRVEYHIELCVDNIREYDGAGSFHLLGPGVERKADGYVLDTGIRRTRIVEGVAGLDIGCRSRNEGLERIRARQGRLKLGHHGSELREFLRLCHILEKDICGI